MARDINQNVNINVNANTNDASQDIERLETNIATLDGAINIVGGSVEVLAGGLALVGAVSDEQAEKFQTAAVGAIAFADGSKRIIEGYRTLAKETKVLTVVQRIYNTVLKANPIFLLASVLAAVALGMALFTKRTDEQAEALAEEAKKQKELNDELARNKKLREDTARVGDILLKNKERDIIKPLEREIALLEAQGATEEEIFKKKQELLNEQIEIYDSLGITYSNDRKLATENEQRKLDAQSELANLRAKEQRRLAEAEMARIKAQETEEERIFNEKAERYEKEQQALRDLTAARIAADVAAAKAAADAANTQKKLAEERVQNNEDLLIGTLDTIQAAAGIAFENNKNLAKANVLVDAGQAALGILNTSYKNVNPNLVIAYQVAQFALLAATVAKSFQSINSANPDGGGGPPSTPRPGSALGGPGFNLGLPQTTGDTSGVTSISAIVLAGDVTSAQAQDAAIRNRRRFG